MFKKIKTSNMILAVIGIFVLLQCMTSLFYLYNSYNNKNSMSVINSSNEKVALLTNTWFAMNSARSNINRVVVWIQNDGPEGEKTLASLQSAKDELKKTALWYDKFTQAGEIAGIDPALTKNLDVAYKNFYASLAGLIAEADKKDPSTLLSYNLTPSFNQMLADYDAWRSAANNMSTKSYVTSQNVFSQMIFGLILIMLIILVIVFLSWYAIKSTLITPLNKALEFIGLIAEGDLSRDIEIDEKSQNEMSRLFSGLKIMKDSIFSTVKTVRESSEIISQEIVKLVDGNNDLSSRTEQQAASLEETAASMEQITQTVTLNAENADQAATEASEAAGSAKMGGEVVSAVSEKIREMEVNAGKISEVTVLIKSIAFQTNILALNAAVEAARAGESGKGFAVVAGEVRNLAQNCANAARDVELLIKESSERVEKSSRLASAANKNIDGVVVSAQNLSHIINEISVASREQKSGISQVGIAITELDKVTQQNYGLVQEAAGSCISLKDQIAILHENVVKFRLY